jgi:hypothetical protein
MTESHRPPPPPGGWIGFCQAAAARQPHIISQQVKSSDDNAR